MLAAYCTAYARWRTTEELLARMDPNARIAGQAARDMVRFAGHFGMTPSARARIAAWGWREPRSKFGDLPGR
jgi:phage terminase small subunit